MTDNNAPDGTEIVVARDYENDAVVVETPDREQRFSPTAARQFANLMDIGNKIPASPFSGSGRLADELKRAADDVENAEGDE
jgi:hypothetical protein